MSDDNVIHDADVSNVLKDDGVGKIVLRDYENKATTELSQIKKDMGKPPWGVRTVYNKRFGGVLICQNPGEGNRMHFHGDADECWVIMEGEWEWYIDGEGTKRVKKDDIILVPAGVKHKITCVGDEPGIRFAITAPDVDHVYVEEDY